MTSVRDLALIRRLALVAMVLLTLAACAAAPTPTTVSPMITLAGNPDRSRDLVVVIPGALTSVHSYDDMPHGQAAVVGYRFPGIDGRPRDRNVRITQAGAEIAAYVNAQGPRRVRLVGSSTGGPIALEAAKRIRGPLVEVAILSSALPTPATAVTTVAGLSDIVGAVHRADTTDRIEVYGEYYRTLLLGRRHYRNPPLAAYSADVAAQVKAYLRLPGDGIARSHSANLLFWTLTRTRDLGPARVLFLHGAEDPVFPIAGVRRLAARLPDARVITYPLSGHLLLVTEPSVYADIEAAFAGWGR